MPLPVTSQAGGLVRNLLDVPAADRSEMLLPTLVGYDRVEFSLCEGLAFRAIQAKRAGLAFTETCLAIHSEPTTGEQRLLQQRYPSCARDTLVDFMEWYVLTHADERLGLEADSPVRVTPSSAPQPVVSIVVPHYNLGAFLPATLESLVRQTYASLDVIVIDDGSTDPVSREVFSSLRLRYPQFRFETQANQGIGATRNRGLALARGEFFLPFDADNVAEPELVERLVRALQRQPETAALSCYFHAFDSDANLAARRALYAVRPTGGPFVLGATQNIYGDACSLYRTEPLRKLGGFGVERGTSFEDWELFVRLVGAGLRVDVVPEVLFWYRHRETGFSRVTNGFANHQRVLRAFAQATHLPTQEREWLTQVLAGMEQQRQIRQSRSLRQRMWAWFQGRD